MEDNPVNGGAHRASRSPQEIAARNGVSSAINVFSTMLGKRLGLGPVVAVEGVKAVSKLYICTFNLQYKDKCVVKE